MQTEGTVFDDPEASNNSLFSTQFNPILKPEKSARKPVPNIAPIQERVSKIQFQLINQICIISSDRLRANQHFTSELKNFRYQRGIKNLFGQSQSKIENGRHLLIATLSDLFEKYRYEKKNTFYVVLSGVNQKGVLHFCHKEVSNKKVQSILVMSLRKCSFLTQIQKEEIQYQNLQKSEEQREKILIRNKYISVFWGFFINYLIYNDTQFQIIGNFQFTNSIHTLPHETYNGVQNREQFEYIANVRKNIFGKQEKEMYNMKIEGLWLKSNLEALIEKTNTITNRKCQIFFNVLPITETLKIEKNSIKLIGKL